MTQRQPSGSKVVPLQQVRLAPHSSEAEEAVIGGVLTDPELFLLIAEYLKPEDFHVNRLGIVWEAMTRISDRNEGIDVVTVSEEIRAMGKTDQFEDKTRVFLVNLINRTPTSVHTDSYARAVQRLAIRRRLIIAADEIKAMGYDTQLSLERIAADSESRLLSVTEEAHGGVPTHIAEVLDEQTAYLKQVMSDKALAGIYTGLSALDTSRIMLFRGDLHILAAPAGQGKSALLINSIALNRLRLKGRVVIISNEMKREAIARRLTSGETRISTEKLRQGTLTSEDKRLYLAAMQNMSNWELYIVDDMLPVTPLGVEKTVRRIMHQYGGVELVIIDGLKAARSRSDIEERARGQYNYTTDLTIIMRELTEVAARLNVPILAAHHLNRQNSKKSKPPTLEGMYGGSAIEQYAQTAWALWREEYDPMVESQPSHLLALKVRDGTPYFDHILEFDKASNRYE
jgi:replicative DNA helicase